ncbi:MAG: M12 family metallo-peptidase [Acidobacteriota bacterium]|nr:M12 family metallo-peptidase [Acidobacteriota bacterium]
MLKTRVFRISAPAAFAVTVMLLGGAPAAQTPAPLFEETGLSAVPPSGASAAPMVLRSRIVRPRMDRLSAAAAAAAAGDPSALLTLNLFDDAVFTAEFERFETDNFGHQSWAGRVVGDPLSAVTLTWRGDVLSGGVQTSSAIYRLLGQAGIVTIEQIDPASKKGDKPPVVPPTGVTIQPLGDVGRPAAGEVVDIFVYYTAQALAAAGGQAAIEAQIAQQFTESNTAFTRSGVNATIRQVGSAELTGYVQNPTDMENDLNAFKATPSVLAMRNQAGADLMHLVVATATGNTCGIADLGPDVDAAFGVTAQDCFQFYTFPHEVGHNFGDNHSLEDDTPPNPNPFRPYSFGYKNCAAGTPFTTIMAYQCPAGTNEVGILNLSNPNVQHMGLVTGTATQHNALSQSEAFPIVQGFRTPAATTLPTAPQNTQTSVVGNNITVSWQAPAQGGPITTYLIQAGTGPGLSDVFNGPVGAATSVSSPIANGTYYIRVAAQNSIGVGPYAMEVVAQVGTPPGPPENVMASALAGVITLSWSPPSSGGAVTSYVVQAGSAPGAADFFNANVGPGTMVSGAVAPGTYYLRVLSQGPGGTSPPSSEATVVVGSACTVPAAPVLTGGQTGGVITISWNTPAGGPVTDYIVRAGSSSGGLDVYNASVGLTNSVSAAVANGDYFIRVAANTACGTSADSNEVPVMVP